MRKKYADSNEITIKTITFKIRPRKCFKHTEKITDPYLHIHVVWSWCKCLLQWILSCALNQNVCKCLVKLGKGSIAQKLVDFVKISQRHQALNIRQVTIRGCTFNQCIQGSSYRVNHSISLMIKWPDTVGVAILYQARRIPLNRWLFSLI